MSSTRFSEAEALLLAGNDQGPAADRPVWALELLVGDLDAATVYRERDNVDLLIEIGSLKLTVVIENKIGARERGAAGSLVVGVIWASDGAGTVKAQAAKLSEAFVCAFRPHELQPVELESLCKGRYLLSD